MQQTIPLVVKRGQGRPRKTETQTVETENKTQQPQMQTQPQNENVLLENQENAPAALLERRVTRSMTKAAETAPATERGECQNNLTYNNKRIVNNATPKVTVRKLTPKWSI